MPRNETQVTDALLGLVSSFMLAIVTDRALLVQWTPEWKTPLDELSVITESSSWSDAAEASSFSSSPSAVLGVVLPSSPAFLNNSHVDRARRVSLGDVLSDPGFCWGYAATASKYQSQKKKAPALRYWNPLERIEALSCKDLKEALGTHSDRDKFIKVGMGAAVDSSSSYFMPLIQVNPFYAAQLGGAFDGGLGWAFADLFNFLVRPVPEVLEAIERFKGRYLDGNSVFGLEMSVMPRRGIWAGEGTMPLEMQNMFFTTASHLLTHDDRLSGVDNDDQGVVFLLVTDNQGLVQSRFHELEAADQVKGAGVVAILTAAGDGKSRVHLELQELWMLGHSDVVIATPGSQVGIVGSARTHKAPLVVLDGEDGGGQAHHSTAPYPCFANFGAVQHTRCFVPSMLSKLPPDSAVPC
jgi:hypothetical protein